MPPLSHVPDSPGGVIRARRIEIGKRQEDLANDAEVSQKLISEIERGEQDLLSAGIGRVRNIARALDWSLNELQEATGLDLGVEASNRPPPPKQHRSSAAAMGYKIPRPKPRPIDPALQKAADEYGDKTELAPLREYRWLRTLNDIPFKRRPTTPEEWLAVFLEHKDEWNPEEPEE